MFSGFLLLLLVALGGASPATQSLSHRVPRATLQDVRFLLWTRSNCGDEEYDVVKGGDSASLGHFNASDPTVVLAHGFSDHGYKGWPVSAKTELLKYGPHNVVSVDWGKLAAAPWYPTAVSYVPQVGNLTASLLDWLHVLTGMDVSGVQVVGHSLGAHVAGAVGQNLRTFTLPFITGLDPAGPEFYSNPASSRLDKSDAEFVQIIHTNGGTVLEGCVGLKDISGHVDFFPNGGKHQPGCTIGGAWIDLLTGGCSHGKSHKYWLESINGENTFLSRPCVDWDTFTAGACDSCADGCLEMGFHVDTSMSGTFYLTTNKNKPFAQGPSRGL